VAHTLDRPVWNALTSNWAHLALGDTTALRIEPDHGPFAASADLSPDGLSALGALPETDGMWVVEREPLPVIPGFHVLGEAPVSQMVAESITPDDEPGFAIEPLGEADAPDMLALATLTEPGPYLTKTYRLGRFVGVRQAGRLVAMAGERMRMPGFAEVSGVCTHPDHRGRGYAAALMRLVAQRMLDEGDTPFLHAYAGNSGAIALYERLGFRYRTTMIRTVLGTG
jgi:ribosomal protein S18 acetylase RimI-like enzyme